MPWPNEPFYFAIVAEDDAGNRGLISNIVSVYIHEEVKHIEIVTPLGADSILFMEMLNYGNSSHIEQILSGLKEPNNSGSGMYIVGGIISGVMTLIVRVRRSNTSATLAWGSSKTGYFSVKDYGAATPGRMPKGSGRVRQGFIERIYWDRVVMPAGSETDLYHSSRLKRKESFV